jgi:precorrin-2 dehydrogenase/sirohydrochlorin ferrochelatase
MARYYPVLLDLQGRVAVVIGGDEIAAEKAAGLAACGAQVTVISPQFCEALQAQAKEGTLTLCQRQYAPDDLAGAFVIIAATNDQAQVEAIWNETQHAGQLVNMVDKPKHCSFILPSILRRGPLTIAVSTDGASPSLAKRIRHQLEKLFPAAYGPYLRLAAAARARLRAGGVSYQERDTFFGAYAASNALTSLEQDDWTAAAETTATLLQRYGIAAQAAELKEEARDDRSLSAR